MPIIAIENVGCRKTSTLGSVTLEAVASFCNCCYGKDEKKPLPMPIANTKD